MQRAHRNQLLLFAMTMLLAAPLALGQSRDHAPPSKMDPDQAAAHGERFDPTSEGMHASNQAVQHDAVRRSSEHPSQAAQGRKPHGGSAARPARPPVSGINEGQGKP
ncbi:hypothetical protein [Cupriavidus sp. USMAHM13]|uniref:hypothetical protein n=1 Tax=Cupriavidus sp. USMAHM13 TaxID=1389192 RepID=UPI0012EAFD19|nr:hypothetical protein [Cupriavidus sp. USMAHM13]